MSAIIYAVPTEFENTVPDIFQNQDKYQELEEKWLEELRQYCLTNGADDGYVGETIRFGVADGYAVYMVASLSPKVELLHLPLMDGYNFEYVHLMNVKEVKKQIDGAKKFEEYMKTQCNVGEVNVFLQRFGEEKWNSIKMPNHICVKWSNPCNDKGEVEYFLEKDNSSYGEQEEKVYNYLQKSFLV